MIKVNIIKENNLIKNINVSGHSGYSEYGSDIVCAAVSSIITTTINGILVINNSIEAKDDQIVLEINVINNDDITNKLLQNMIDLLKGIEVQYPKNIKVITKGE